MEKLGIGSRVQHPRYGQGVVTGFRFAEYLVTFIDHGTHEIAESDVHLEVLDRADVPSEMETQSDMETSLVQILRKWSDTTEIVHLGERWNKGTMILQPFDKTLKPKEIPIDIFFHKIVMLHDRLRVLEQNINSNAKLDDEDKINLQQYITRIYGTLTTFNVLFRNKEHQFVGEKGKED
jgi:hypothetical protein